MQELLELILTNITTHPDEINVESSEEDGQIVFTITVHPDDMGRVIGKNGKVIRAIRSLAHVVGIRQDQRYRVNVAEVADERQPESEPTTQDSDIPTSSPEPQSNEDEQEATPTEPKDDVIAGAIDFDVPEESEKESK